MVIQHACPGAGACGGMYTANTMACVAEAIGPSATIATPLTGATVRTVDVTASDARP